MHQPFVSLVIPCYNERDRVQLMMEALHDFIQQWQGPCEVIIVDDGSVDGTEEVIRSNPLFNSDHMQFIRQNNTGKGGALKLGVSRAQGDYILTLDADMAASPLELIAWLKEKSAFNKNEILIGSREKNKLNVQDKAHRKFIGHVFNRLIRTMTGLTQLDTQCGFKLYANEVAQQLFKPLQTLGWAHDVELLCRAQHLGYSIIEMPITWKAVEGSKIRIVRDSWRMFWELVRIRNMVFEKNSE